MLIYLGTDHAGFESKEKIKKFLLDNGHQVEDMGNFEFDQKDDYPDFIFPVAKKVAEDPENRKGIVLGWSGQGEAIASNRIKGVRAVVLYDYNEEIIRLSREHNNANVLSLGTRFLTGDESVEAVKIWLGTEFTNEERHVRRIKKLDEI